MKLISLAVISSVFCVSNEKQAILDRFAGSKKGEFEKSGHLVHFTSPGKKFEFELGSYKKNVSSLVQAFQIASGFIENAIQLYNPIKVQVNYGDFCPSSSVCKKDASKANIGFCRPVIHEKLVNGFKVLFPNAVIKQQKDGSRVAQKFDMQIYIKDSSFVLPEDYGQDIKEKSNDIMDVIIHELGHGLGITSSIIKELHFCYHKKTDCSNGKFTRSWYDSHLHFDVSLNDFLNSTEIDKRAPASPGSEMRLVAAKYERIYNLQFTKDSMFFLTKNKTKVFLDTMPTRLGGFDHFAESYKGTTDYLMTFSSNYHGAFKAPFTQNRGWKTSPIGESMIQVLETLGYTRNPNPDVKKSQLYFFYLMSQKHQKDNTEGRIIFPE